MNYRRDLSVSQSSPSPWLRCRFALHLPKQGHLDRLSRSRRRHHGASQRSNGSRVPEADVRLEQDLTWKVVEIKPAQAAGLSEAPYYSTRRRVSR